MFKILTKTTSASLAILIFSLFFTLSAEARPVCGSKSISGIYAKYCYQKPDRPTKTLLVYFHGIYQNEQRWFTRPKLIAVHNKLKASGLDPLIITISFGHTWLLTSQPESRYLFNVAMDQLLPQLIKEIHPQPFNKKFLVGYSMGGFNAAQVLLRRPKLFDKYVLLSPAITTIGPYSPQKEIKDYIWRTGAMPALITFMLRTSYRTFHSMSEWTRYNPLDVVKNAKRVPPVYISAGSWDEYGFDEGAYAFYQAILKKSRMPMWVPIRHGFHDDNDPRSIAWFLLR